MFDVQLFCQAVLFFASCIAGVVSAITIALTMGDFDGDCVLFGSWTKETTYFETHHGKRANCNFILTTHGVFSVLFPLVAGCYFIYAVRQSYHNNDFAYKMWVKPYCLLAGLVTFLLLIASGIISAGFASWCDAFVVIAGQRCAVMEGGKWIHSAIKHKSTYTQLKVLEIASWVCLLLWVLQTSLCILRVIRNRRRLSREIDQESDRANIGRANPSA